jgi:hypothetical protein
MGQSGAVGVEGGGFAVGAASALEGQSIVSTTGCRCAIPSNPSINAKEGDGDGAGAKGRLPPPNKARSWWIWSPPGATAAKLGKSARLVGAAPVAARDRSDGAAPPKSDCRCRATSSSAGVVPPKGELDPP